MGHRRREAFDDDDDDAHDAFEVQDARLRALETTLDDSDRVLRDLQVTNAALAREARQLRQDMDALQRDLDADVQAVRRMVAALDALSRDRGAGAVGIKPPS